LTVNIDQLRAQFAKYGHSHQCAVDTADILSVRVNIPLDNGLRIILHSILCKPRVFLHIREHSTDGGLIGTGADHITVGTFTKHSRYGIDDDGFTGTGLTGEYIKTGIEGNVGALNDRNILNVQ